MIVESFSVSRQRVAGAIEKCLQSLIGTVQVVFGGRLASLDSLVGAVVISLFTNFPAYSEFNNMLRNDPIVQAIGIKTQNPLSPIPPSLKELESHNDKLELRLTVPILGWLSGTGIWTVIIWSHLAGLGVFYLLSMLANNALSDEVGVLFRFRHRSDLLRALVLRRFSIW